MRCSEVGAPDGVEGRDGLIIEWSAGVVVDRPPGEQMRQQSPRPRAAIGFTVKSGWASAVLLTGSATSPGVVDSRRVDLSDPAMPESRQPYHAGFGTARDAGPERTRLIASVKRYGRHALIGVIRDYQNAGHRLRGVGVVVGSLIDPERISNDHIRIHALEGRLFRRVVEDAVARQQLPSSVWRQRDLSGLAAQILQQPEATVRSTLAMLGRNVAGAWRAEQKTAALAAWLILAGRATATRTSRGA
jgi:hypothetical protein